MSIANHTVVKYQTVLPEGILVVPELYRGVFNTVVVDDILFSLKCNGSYAAPGYKRPEGVVVFHTAGEVGFKKTIEKDDKPKSKH